MMSVPSAFCLQAADVTGQWIAQVPGRDGNTMETTFDFKAAGEKLTGTMENQYGSREISEGKVSGDDIAFNVNIEFNDNKMTLVFTGKVVGGEISSRESGRVAIWGRPASSWWRRRNRPCSPRGSQRS